MPNLGETARQNVLEKPADELERIDRHLSPAVALVLAQKPTQPARDCEGDQEKGHGSRRSIWFSSQALALSC